MKSQELARKLLLSLEEHGFKAVIVSASHIPELRAAIENNRASSLIDEGVYGQYAESFDGMLSQDASWARSIIVIAAPQPLLEATFVVGGERRSVLIPPTYDHAIDETVTAAVESELRPHGFQVSRAALPQKLLAARTGLARYGRNNIAYVDGMGSFHRLITFYSDLPVHDDRWQDSEMLDECTRCNACIKKCPTGAIDPDQFQLRAERCLTFHNESSKPFPRWINESWHHCLVGCMRCQQYCPVNKDVRSWTARFAEFTDEESTLLLNGADQGGLPESLISKFEYTELLEDPHGLTRNLNSVLALGQGHR